MIEEKWRRESGLALNEFSDISKHIYAPLLLNVKAMLDEVGQHAGRARDNLEMYYNFMWTKL